MQRSERRFCRWSAMDDTPAEGAPKLPVVVQIKIAHGLLQYPNGKSAMVWYGGGQGCTEALALARRAVGTRYALDELRWRWRPAEAVSRDLAVLLARFDRRFGSVPYANQ